MTLNDLEAHRPVGKRFSIQLVYLLAMCRPGNRGRAEGRNTGGHRRLLRSVVGV